MSCTIIKATCKFVFKVGYNVAPLRTILDPHARNPGSATEARAKISVKELAKRAVRIPWKRALGFYFSLTFEALLFDLHREKRYINICIGYNTISFVQLCEFIADRS